MYITMKFNDKSLKSKSISSTEKLVYGLIGALSNKNSYCYASNEYISKQLNVSKKTISKAINKLKKENYIRVENENYKRIIYMVGMEENV